MSTLHNYDDNHLFSEYSTDEDPATLTHRRLVRKLLDDKLEQKRLREEMEDIENDFDWNEFDNR